MFNDTITLFNRYHSKTEDIWYPRIIKNVELNNDKASIIERYGAESKDTAKLFIHYNVAEDKIFIGDYEFKPPKEWHKSDYANMITFNDNATYFDFFIVGDKGYNAPINDKDYDKGFYNELNNSLDYCYAITSVGCYKLLPHFEILAK